MICRKKLRLWFVIPTLLTFIPNWAPTDFVRPTTHRRGAVRLAASGETWWCQGVGINGKLKDCFEANMQVDGVPLLKNYNTYQASFPVRELRNGSLLTLYQLPFFARITDLNTVAKGWAVNWRCATPLTILLRLPILVSRHRSWWVSFVPAS